MALCLQACASESVIGDYPPSTCDLTEAPSDANDTTVYLSTFWVGKEEAAVASLIDHLPTGYGYQPLVKETRLDSLRKLETAFGGERLPDVFQANGGSDVLRWVRGGGEGSAICPLDRLSATYGWQGVYFPRSLQPVSCRGSLYALPVGIHRLNVLFYNRDLFAKLKEQAALVGVTLVEPEALKSPYDLLEQLEQVTTLGAKTDEGKDIVPLTMGTTSRWPLTVLGFENVLMSLGGNAYHTLWEGGLQGDDGTRSAQLTGKLEEMLAILRRLVEFSAIEREITWQDALLEVGRGEALFTVTGDWGWAQLEEEQAANVATVAFPGTSSSFVYTPDSFAVPRQLGQSGYRAHTFLQSVIAEKESLIDFSSVKHAIPPRNDIDPRRLATQALRETYQRFNDCSVGVDGCEVVLAVSGLGPPPGFDACLDDIDAVLNMAVLGRIPEDPDAPRRRLCTELLPTTKRQASTRMMELLMNIGNQRFAADCR